MACHISSSACSFAFDLINGKNMQKLLQLAICSRRQNT